MVKTEQEQWDLSTSKNPFLNEYPQVRETQPETSCIIKCLHISFQAIATVSHTITHPLVSEYSVIPEQAASKHGTPYLLFHSFWPKEGLSTEAGFSDSYSKRPKVPSALLEPPEIPSRCWQAVKGVWGSGASPQPLLPGCSVPVCSLLRYHSDPSDFHQLPSQFTISYSMGRVMSQQAW